MKKFLVAGVALLGWGSALAAPVIPDPAELPGGLSGKNVIHDSNSTFNGQTITNALGNINTAVTDAQATANNAASGVSANASAISSETERAKAAESTNASVATAAQTTANAAIPLTQKGSANGVAALDANSSLPSPASTVAGAPVNGGTDVLSSFQTSPVKSIEAFNPSDSSIGRQFTVWGGHSQNDISALKATCKNISGGDEGGVCYQFIDGTGPEYDYRSGSGTTDGVNVEMDSAANAPLDVIGGGVASADGVTYTVTYGSNYATISPALSDKELALFRSRMSIFTNMANGMSSKESTSYDGTDNVDLPNYYMGYMSSVVNDTSTNTSIVTIESYYYPGQNPPGSVQGLYLWRTISQPSPYPYPNASTWTQTAYSSASSGATTLTIAGNISPPDAGADSYNACGVWTCTISGASIASGTTITGWSSSGGNTILTLSTATTGAITADQTINFSVFNEAGDTDFKPGAMSGDTLDNKISGNTNYHSYTSNALFLGQSVKDFNEYHLQADYQPKDNITRAHDNEYDFWMNGADHDGQLSSRGLTLVWQGQHRLATGSWMMRLAGFNLQPTGLYVDGVTNGGLEFRSDTGLFAFKQTGKESSTIGTYTPSALLGSVGSSSGYGQLGWYASEDGSTNGSYHLGLTSSTSNLQYNVDPKCVSTNVQPSPSWSCNIGGQVVFDPEGYSGGISLGVGAGSAYKPGITVSSSGVSYFGSDLHTGAGGSVWTTDPSGNEAAYIYASTSDQMNVSFSNSSSASKTLQVNGAVSVAGGISSSAYTGTNLTGTGNAYACVNASGQLYRSATACN